MLLSLMCVTFLGTVGTEPWFPPVPVEVVRRKLGQGAYHYYDADNPPPPDYGVKYVRTVGPRAYPALLTILTEDDQGRIHSRKGTALRVLCGQPHDRSLFLDVTLKYLDHENSSFREAALELLSEIGCGDQVEKVYLLLFHKDITTRKRALKTIVAIGDVRHVPVLAKYLSPLPADVIHGGSFHTAVQDAIKELEKKPAPKAKAADKK
jgi:hypothetical protein